VEYTQSLRYAKHKWTLPARLYFDEINPKNVRSRKEFGHLDSPNTGPGAYVKYFGPCTIRTRGKDPFNFCICGIESVEHCACHLMLKIKTAAFFGVG
jgi:hypothetical protein